MITPLPLQHYDRILSVDTGMTAVTALRIRLLILPLFVQSMANIILVPVVIDVDGLRLVVLHLIRRC